MPLSTKPEFPIVLCEVNPGTWSSSWKSTLNSALEKQSQLAHDLIRPKGYVHVFMFCIRSGSEKEICWKRPNLFCCLHIWVHPPPRLPASQKGALRALALIQNMTTAETWAFSNLIFIASTSWQGIFKLLRSPGIDFKESISSAYVAWRDGTTTLFLLGS